MSEDELQLDEENNEMENLDKDENKEDSNIENDINIGQEKEQKIIWNKKRKKVCQRKRLNINQL